jgi:hypothetical protein
LKVSVTRLKEGSYEAKQNELGGLRKKWKDPVEERKERNILGV